MRIVGGLDVHRAQITFDCVDLRTGEELRGQIKPATREEVRAFLAGFGGEERGLRARGNDGLALHRRRATPRGNGGTPRRTRRHSSSAWPKAPGEDRPRRRATAARSADRR